MRVLVVDDSAFMRKRISAILAAQPGIEVVGLARDGDEGVRKALELRPDLITLDLEMPKMDGLTALRHIRLRCREFAPAVLVCSSLTPAGGDLAFRALQLGAADVLPKERFPPASIATFAKELSAKALAVGLARRERTNGYERARPHADTPGVTAPSFDAASVRAIVIGASTGGPPVLEQILGALEPAISAPIVVALHTPAVFTRTLAERIGRIARIRVEHGRDRAPLEPGCAYIVPGGSHARVEAERSGRLTLNLSDPSKAPTADPDPVPSVNQLFASAAASCGSKALGVVLTGMGQDGADGAAALRAEGAPVIVQSEDTCVVYGMPRAVAERGCASAILPPHQIARLLGWVRAVTPAAA